MNKVFICLCWIKYSFVSACAFCIPYVSSMRLTCLRVLHMPFMCSVKYATCISSISRLLCVSCGSCMCVMIRQSSALQCFITASRRTHVAVPINRQNTRHTFILISTSKQETCFEQSLRVLLAPFSALGFFLTKNQIWNPNDQWRLKSILIGLLPNHIVMAAQ